MKTVKYFSAVWCGPCQTFKPTMKELASEGYNIEFIDVDTNNEAAQRSFCTNHYCFRKWSRSK